jgi:hypothetical protein
MVAATIWRVGLRDLAGLGRSSLLSSRPGTDDLMAATI